ncbi:MAG: HlyD family secretion protein [Acidobacteria bacterium]|nr:HlyD family secretion protein [Acidobacteriota bacterium]
MNRKRKIIIGMIVLVVLGGVVAISITRGRQDAVAVQVEKAKRRDRLQARVSANGEVRPIKFYNLTAEVPGRVLRIMVREGDPVKKGAPLLTVDPTQLESSAAGSQATLQSARADLQNSEVALRAAENTVINTQAVLASAKYNLERSRSDLTYAEEEYKRQVALVEQGISSRSQFDLAKNRFEAQRALLQAQESQVEQTEAQLRDSKIRVEQSRSQIAAAKARVAQSEASLRGTLDQLHKTTQFAPIDGVISTLSIREGEYAVSQLSSSQLMMIADMSQITVEVQVDETDVTHVVPGQVAKIKVDALSDKELTGTVSEVGQAARSKSGTALGSLSGTSQEAKDFKVVINLVDLQEDVRNRLRPGMSATAVITTDTRENVIAVPLQALVQRDPAALEPAGKESKSKPVQADTKENKPASADGKKEIQGIFVVQGDKAVFRPVQTGIIGETDIEITSGLEEGTEVVIGPYRELRTLKNNAVIKKEAPSTTPSDKKP